MGVNDGLCFGRQSGIVIRGRFQALMVVEKETNEAARKDFSLRETTTTTNAM